MSRNTNSRRKSERSRVPNTSSINNLTDEAKTRSPVRLAEFSSDAGLFAVVLPSVNNQRLCIFDTLTGSLTAEHTVERDIVTSLSWEELRLGSIEGEQQSTPPYKRQKKAKAAHSLTDCLSVVALGLSNGAAELYSPSHARIVRSFSDSTSVAAVKAVRLMQPAVGNNDSSIAVVGSADGVIRAWEASKNVPIESWKLDGFPALSTIDFGPNEASFDTLVADTRIALFSSPLHGKPLEVATFQGHVSKVTILKWEHDTRSRRFISASEDDRFIHIWEAPSLGLAKRETLLASLGLEDRVRSVFIGSAQSTGTSRVLVLTSSSAHVVDLPTTKLGSDVVCKPISNLRMPLQRDSNSVELLHGAFVSDKSDYVRFALLAGGSSVSFADMRFAESSGKIIEEVSLQNLLVSQPLVALPADRLGGDRYAETPAVAVQTGKDFSRDAELLVATTSGQNQGALDVDLAELSLGQRLGVSIGTEPEVVGNSRDNVNQEDTSRISVSSLSRVLNQALHSSDSGLLETCLNQSDPTLIFNTVRKLQPQLALPLISACVERLGRGHRGIKGGGGGASPERAATLLTWVRACLILHSSHLMALPDIVPRLSGLHAVLTNRLAMRDRLLLLSGRLDLALAQMEVRANLKPNRQTTEAGKDSMKITKTTVYVEGDSSGNDSDLSVEVETDDEGGSIEEVELGQDDRESSDDDDGSEHSSQEDSDSEESGSDEQVPYTNGLQDDAREDLDGLDDSDIG